jgi:ribose-phosphate pyrophosphokinase
VRQATLQALPSARGNAERVARRLGVPFAEIKVQRFPDGELRVTVGAASPTTLIYAPLNHPNDKLIAILFAAEALRRTGATRLVLVAPYLCYMRQDAAFRRGQAISQKVLGSLLSAAVDRVVTIDAHLHRAADLSAVFSGIEADNLSAVPAIAAALRESGFDRKTVVVGPDVESQPRISVLAKCLGLDYAIARKTRRNDRSVAIEFSDPNSFADRPALIMDDIVSSGGTLVACAKALTAAGATTVDAVITHALFSAKQMAVFARAGIRSPRSTNSVPHPTNAIPIDEVLAAALERELRAERAP